VEVSDVTEPPEPRNPDEDGGDDAEMEELREFLDSEFFGEMSDDMLLDEISRGEEHRRVDDEMPDEDWALQDELHDWRDDVEEEPHPPKLDPKEIMAEYERRKKAEEPPAPRAPSSGGAGSMAINEEAGRIRAIAENQSVSGAAQQAAGKIGEVQLNIQGLSDASAALQQGLGSLENEAGMAAVSAGGDDGTELEGAGGRALEAFNTAIAQIEGVKNLAEQLASAMQSASSAAEAALEADQAFRQACSQVAGKHGA
jgi:hypothetical protein